MAKSANGNMMTRPQLSGCSGTLSPGLRTVTVWETEVPIGVQRQSPHWWFRLGRSSQKLRSLGPLLINFKQNFSNAVI